MVCHSAIVEVILSAHCCSHSANPEPTHLDPKWRQALWIALFVNGAMFAVELAAGELADSRSLQADAIDFFADAANYAISLGVAGLALAWRARAALFKGISLLALGGFVAIATLLAAVEGSQPQPYVIGGIGIAALVANLAVAALLFRWRSGDANMRSVWLCTRNDAIANVAVVFAALGVFGTGTRWPDLIVASIMALLSLSAGIKIIRLSLAELRAGTVTPASVFQPARATNRSSR